MQKFFMTIILLGAVQGFILSALLCWGNRNRKPNRLLAWLIFLLSSASLCLCGNYVAWFHNSWLNLLGELLPLICVMPMGPLIYFYTRTLIDPATKVQKIHFLPIIIDLVPSFVVILYFSLVLSRVIPPKPGPWGRFIDDYNVYSDIPRWISVTGYLWLTHRYLRLASSPYRKWLKQFVTVFLAFQGIWFIYLVPYVIPKYTDWMLNTFDWYPIYVPIAVMIYWLGIKGYIVSYQTAPVAKKAVALATDAVDKTIALLRVAMEKDLLYLNPGCNLSVVSQHTGLPAKTISAVLNQHLNTSFNEYLNGYRVAAFKKKIIEPDFEHLTLTGIAFDCGFNSQATFQRTFKEVTGMSPTEYRKSTLKSGSEKSSNW